MQAQLDAEEKSAARQHVSRFNNPTTPQPHTPTLLHFDP